MYFKKDVYLRLRVLCSYMLSCLIGMMAITSCVNNEPLEEREELNEYNWLSGGEFIVVMKDTGENTDDNPFLQEESSAGENERRSFMLVIRDQYYWPGIVQVDDFRGFPSDVVYIDDKLMTLNIGGEIGIMQEDYLLRWEAREVSRVSLNSVVSGGDIIMAVGNEGTVLKDWIPIVVPGLSYDLEVVLSDGNSTFVIAGGGPNIYVTKDKGSNWTVKEIQYDVSGIQNATNNIQSGIYAENIFILVGLQGVVLISRDGGEKWSQNNKLDSAIQRVDLYGITYGKGKFFMVGSSDNERRTTSLGEGTVQPSIVLVSDSGGRLWQEKRLPQAYTNTLLSVAYRLADSEQDRRYASRRNSLVVAVGKKGGIVYSGDGGETWKMMGIEESLKNNITDKNIIKQRYSPEETRSLNTSFFHDNRFDFISIVVYR